ncbi:hypothetical protein [Streptomyces mobaraensis]|uniref:Uncharacterized protein n=1 Tax=Streptomyces mobaraensis TaxID=35621 RepID=A0A5N5W5G7_STRMB|nr:hypothetical protein [Streptomyces mobaraensis]KAB7839471.1 hypothetical protein FRZ00_21250 [Streptomyces mobaraensis]
MPIIAVEVRVFERMRQNLRVHLKRACIPEYSWKERRAGFKVWHAEHREGETLIFWHTFDPDDYQDAQREGLESCAFVLQEHYWVKIDMPCMYTNVNRPTLRVLYGLSWLK